MITPKNLTKILIAPDKFKGTLTAQEVCDALASGLSRRYPEAEIRSFPMADGGDGTLEILSSYLVLQKHFVETSDPLGRPISAFYLADEDRAFIELASASGMVLLSKEERNPMLTSTYGTGLLVKDALQKGKREIYLLLGGSATNDMGLGIASALGVAFEGVSHAAVTGGDLQNIKAVKFSRDSSWAGVKFTLLCDVNNPLYGKNGAAHVYARQKGASDTDVEVLDNGLQHASAALRKLTGVDSSALSGAGAAGGIGGGLVPLFGAELKSGFEVIKALTQLEKQVAWAELVFTGEGQLDEQSLQGKVVGNILALCEAHSKTCHVVVGQNALSGETRIPPILGSIITLIDIAGDVETAMNKGNELLERVGVSIEL